MAEFKEELVINALHPEKAEVGKKYLFADNIIALKKKDEGEIIAEANILKKIDSTRFFVNEIDISWNLLYPYEEPPKQRMTNIQLMEWLSKGNGVFKFKGANPYCYIFENILESELNDEVKENAIIRTWDSEEWIEPTVDIYERDCKGSKE